MSDSRGSCIVVGVTGSFCSGKTTVCSILKDLGAYIVDADDIVHNILKNNNPVKCKIMKYFGRDVISGHEIDRKILASKVFVCSKNIKFLENLLHPLVIAEIKKTVKLNRKKEKLIVLDVPLLFETGLDKFTDVNVVVYTSKSRQIELAYKRTGLLRCNALRIISTQMPAVRKKKLADFIIRNSGSLKELKNKTVMLHANINRKFQK